MNTHRRPPTPNDRLEYINISLFYIMPLDKRDEEEEEEEGKKRNEWRVRTNTFQIEFHFTSF